MRLYVTVWATAMTAAQEKEREREIENDNSENTEEKHLQEENIERE